MNIELCRRMCGLTSSVLQPSNRSISIFQNSCLGKCYCVYSSQSYSWVVNCSSNQNLVLDCAAFGIFQISIDQLHAQFFDPVISIKDSVVAGLSKQKF